MAKTIPFQTFYDIQLQTEDALKYFTSLDSDAIVGLTITGNPSSTSLNGVYSFQTSKIEISKKVTRIVSNQSVFDAAVQFSGDASNIIDFLRFTESIDDSLTVQEISYESLDPIAIFFKDKSVATDLIDEVLIGNFRITTDGAFRITSNSDNRIYG